MTDAVHRKHRPSLLGPPRAHPPPKSQLAHIRQISQQQHQQLNAACMEHLLVRCAQSIESNDATLSQQLLWVLNNIAPPDGNSNQRLTSAFLRALILRASRTSAIASSIPSASHTTTTTPSPFPLRLSAIALAAFLDLTPWHRFGFSAANAAIVDAADGFSVLHLVDLSSTHGMQIPTLIEALAARAEGAPFLRVSVVGSDGGYSPPPSLDMSLDEVGCRLVSFARSRNVGMEFRVVDSSADDGFKGLVEQLRAEPAGGEALVFNCHMMPHRIPDESAAAAAAG